MVTLNSILKPKNETKLLKALKQLQFVTELRTGRAEEDWVGLVEPMSSVEAGPLAVYEAEATEFIPNGH